jgi:DNA helicase-2/ATP-dependent DNA helicase PcrA
MDPILDGLDEGQRAVVTTTDGPVLVVAGAGSGKTTTLIRRVAWMLNHGVPPASILLLTFTRAAAHNMVSRARALVPEAAQITGGTFHSVASGVIRDLHEVFGLPERFTVLDPEDVEDAMKLAAAAVPFPGKGRAPKASTIVAVASLAANTRSPLAAAVERRAPDHVELTPWFQQVIRTFRAWKLDRALLDYDDLLLFFATALAHPEVGPHLRERWPYVLVDEHQDSNALQLQIVYGLGGDGSPNLLVVGDPAQAIYGFRGAAPETLFDFAARYPARVLALETSYRSTSAVIALVNAIDHAMTPRFDRTLRAAPGTDGPRPELVIVGTEATQAEEVCRRILADRDAGVDLADQAVLVRSMWAARRVEAELLAQKIPYRVVGGLRIDEAAHVKDVLSLARVADNPLNEPAWARVLGRLDGMGPAGTRKAVTAILADDGAAVDRASRVPWPKKADPAPLLAALRALEASDAPVSQRLRSAFSAFDPVLQGVYEAEWPERRRDLETVVSLSDEHPSLATFLAAVTLDYSLDARARIDGAPRPEERPLTVSTVHSAKGLEWHSVHVPSFVAGHIPSPYAATAEEQAEELRIFYVATSRARRRLTLYRPLVSLEGWPRPDSPFLPLVAPHLDRVDPRAPKAAPKPALKARIDMRAALLEDE